MRARAFSLLELIVACSLFAALSVLIFTFFRYGTRAFQTVNQKHNLQLDALKSVESLKAELMRSAQSSVYLDNSSAREMTVDGETVHRDVMAFATLKNWHDKTNSENFEIETGAPRWNRYCIFYASREPDGQLIRLKVDPNPPPEAPIPLLRDQVSKLHYDDPQLNNFDGATPSFTILARNVYSFKIESLLEGSYPITLKLREKHQVEAVEQGRRRDFDYYELKTRIIPENSFRNDL